MVLARRRVVLWVLVVAAILGGLVYAFRPRPVPVDLATVTRGPLEVTIEAEGRTRIRDTYQVFAPIAGFALRSPVEAGDPVTGRETVVAVIRPAEPAFLDTRARQQAEAAVAEAEAALQAAGANIVRAVADLDYARSQYERVRTLAERGTVSQSMLDDARLLLETRQAALEAARSEREMHAATLERMRAQLVRPTAGEDVASDADCCTEITAPIDGVVLGVAEESARLVQAGDPLVEIGRAEDLEVEVELLSSDAVRIPPDAAATIDRWGGDTLLAARVRRVEPSAFTKVSALGIEEQRVRVYLDFLDPPDARPRLGDAFRVYVRIVEWRGEDVLQVPVAALFREGESWRLFRIEDGRARGTTVTIGRRNATAAEVVDGLAPGDPVIVHPSDRVGEGVRIVDRAAL
jgi:HlyD family secretion protein